LEQGRQYLETSDVDSLIGRNCYQHSGLL